jgi:hypothetical protein
MGVLSIDPQIIGCVDDRSAVGVLRNKPALGNIVAVPFRLNWGELTAIGSGSAATLIQSGYGISQEPIDSCLSFTVPAVTGHGAMWQGTFYGPVFGFSIYRVSSSTYVTDRLSCLVDGEAYPCRVLSEMMASRAYAGNTDMRGMFVAVDDLPDLPQGRPHHAYITCASHPSTATTSLFITSLLLDGRYYAARLPDYYVKTPFLPITSATGLFADSATSAAGTGSTMFRVVRKLIFQNLASAARIVEIRVGAAVMRRITLAALDSAGDSAEIDFGADIHNTTLSWIVTNGSASEVQAMVTGRT